MEVLFPTNGILTTARLPSIVRRFLAQVERIGPEKVAVAGKACNVAHDILCKLIPENLGKIKNLDEHSFVSSRTLIRFVRDFLATDPMDPAVSISIRLTWELIRSVISKIPSIIKKRTEMIDKAVNSISPVWTSLPWELLKEKGWCPSELLIIFKQLNTSGLLFLDQITPLGATVNHQMTLTPQGLDSIHPSTACTRLGCSFKKVSDLKYRTRHVDGCCGCIEFETGQNDVSMMLKSGHIPLISSINDDDKSGKIKLVAADLDTPYVAISHVWSDGLGNLTKNALPGCQLLRLSNLVQNLPQTSPRIDRFWLDTICVPPDEVKQDEAQTVALQMMGKTYEDAAAVLVLDSWLSSCKIIPGFDVEPLVRIFVSHWNRRLWTFQEGVLAKKLYFHFLNATYDLDHGMKHVNSINELVLDHTLKPSLNAQYLSLRGFQLYGENLSLEGKMLSIFRTTRYRSTSVAADEALCLAGIFGFDTAKIAVIRHPDEEVEQSLRMQQFWRMVRTVPAELLFYEGEVLEFKGFRWAPRTLLRSKFNMMAMEDWNPATNIATANKVLGASPSAEGLSVQRPGFILNPRGGSLAAELYVVDERDVWFMLKPHLREVLEQVSTTEPKLRQGIDPPPAEVAFICDRDEHSDSAFDIIYQGLFAAVYKKSDSGIRVGKICNVTAMKLTPGHYEDTIDRLNTWRQALIDDGTNRKETNFNWLEDDQRWYVD